MTPSTIVAIYTLVTALWLAFSDPLLSALSEDAALVATLQNYKG